MKGITARKACTAGRDNRRWPSGRSNPEAIKMECENAKTSVLARRGHTYATGGANSRPLADASMDVYVLLNIDKLIISKRSHTT